MSATRPRAGGRSARCCTLSRRLSVHGRRVARRLKRNPRVRIIAGVLAGVAAAAAISVNLSCSSSRVAPPPPPGPLRGAPSPQVGVPADTRIRVLLLEGVAGFDLSVAGPCAVVDARGRTVKSFPGGIERTPVSAAREGIVLDRLRLALVAEGPGELLRPPTADESIPAAARLMTWIEIVPEPGGTMTVGSSRYKGRLRVVRDGMTLCAVNVLDVEDYLPGVLRGEVPSNWPAEALKAQAVASRTFALYEKSRRPPDALYDVRATVASQVYRGDDGSAADPTALAVEQTRGEVLVFNGQWVHAYFSSTCGGRTEPPSICWPHEPVTPPLVGTDCSFCRSSPTFRWGPVVWSKEKIGLKLRRKAPARFGRAFGDPVSVKTVGRAAGGRPVELLLTGTTGAAVRMSAYDFRLWVSEGEPRSAILPSSFFEIVDLGSSLSFTGRGFGHGVGLCQYGCRGQAAAGRTYRQILAHYYPGAALIRIGG